VKKRVTVESYRPVKAAKEHGCDLCPCRIKKGQIHMLLKLDVGRRFPGSGRACWRCHLAGTIKERMKNEEVACASCGTIGVTAEDCDCSTVDARRRALELIRELEGIVDGQPTAGEGIHEDR
jgi:hypothetical protein